MVPAIKLICGYDINIRVMHQTLARTLMLYRKGLEMPVAVQRAVWFTSSAAYQTETPDAVALAVQLDTDDKLMPAATEDGVEITKPATASRQAKTNILIILGDPNGVSALALADAMPRYLHLVSNCKTILVVEKDLGEAINRAFGWNFTDNPIGMLAEYISLTADGNPATSFSACAIAFAREATGDNRYYVDSLNTPSKAPYVIVADDDARQLTFRAWENWDESAVEKTVVEVVPITPPTHRQTDVIDRPA